MTSKPKGLVVVGTSQGGLEALKSMLTPIPVDFPVAILVVRHQAATSDDYVVHALNAAAQLTVKFAEQGEPLHAGVVYLAPPDRHLLVTSDRQIKLTRGEKVNYSRPAIDTLFISAAKAFGHDVLAVVLTGANHDGAAGAEAIKKCGGSILVQDPESAEAAFMPNATIAAVTPDHIVWLDQIGPFLWQYGRDFVAGKS